MAGNARPAAVRRRLSPLIFGGAATLAIFFGAYQLVEHSFLEPHLDSRALTLLHVIRGITASVLLATLVGIYMVRHHGGALRENSTRTVMNLVDREERQRRYLRWFVQMRWIAAVVSLSLVMIAVPLTHMLPAGALPLLLGWCGLLVVANVLFSFWMRRGGDAEQQMLVQILVDLLVLSGLLNASGGVENPLYVTYLFHVIIAAIILPKSRVVAVTFAASAFFSLLAVGEYLRILPHYTIVLFPHEHLVEHAHDIEHASFSLVFVLGRVIPFVGVLFLTAYFTSLVIDRLKQSESDLEQAAAFALLERRRLESVIDAAGVGMVVVDSDHLVQWVNARAAAWLGSPEPSIGSTIQHQHEEGGCLACLTTATIENGMASEIERRAVHEGTVRFFRHAASPVCGEDGRVVQVVHLVEDITERKALEAEALHAGKLSVLGQMAAGIAHEIGNPLSSLEARLQRLKRDTAPEFVAQSLEVLQSQINRIGRIVRGVSHFSRSQADSWTCWDLNKVVTEAVSLIKLDRRAGKIAFRERLATPIPSVRGVRDQVEQVIVNLLLNAVEAMPDGGRIDVTTTVTDHQVCVSIQDEGVGMDDLVRTRLFQPFFTTKSNGTGLGLSICYSLVHAHGGKIDVTSEPGKGSCFTVKLPVAA